MSGTRGRSLAGDAAGRPRTEVPALVERRVRTSTPRCIGGRPPPLAICRPFDIAVCQRTPSGKRVLGGLGGLARYGAHLVSRPRDVNKLRTESRGVVENASQAHVLPVDPPFGPGDSPDRHAPILIKRCVPLALDASAADNAHACRRKGRPA